MIAPLPVPGAELYRAQLRHDDLSIAKHDVIQRAAADLRGLDSILTKTDADMAYWEWVCSIDGTNNKDDPHA